MNTLSKNENPELKWFVFYTKSRAEKATHKELIDKGYDVFLPLQKKLKIWKNRQRKFIDEPLFTSYIFVKARFSDIYNISKTKGIYMCILFDGKPCIVPDKDMEAIRIMIESEKEISSNNDFKEGETVCVIKGPLAGYEGILFKQDGNSKFGIKIQGVDLVASINISINDIQKMNK